MKMAVCCDVPCCSLVDTDRLPQVNQLVFVTLLSLIQNLHWTEAFRSVAEQCEYHTLIYACHNSVV
jgi:hypothetical protein